MRGHIRKHLEMFFISSYSLCVHNAWIWQERKAFLWLPRISFFLFFFFLIFFLSPSLCLESENIFKEVLANI